MKQFLFLFALLVSFMTAKAQSVVNHTPCDMRIRVVCIDAACNPVSWGAWITVPGLTFTPMTLPTCTTPGYSTAYEVTGGVGSSCAATAVKVKDIPGCPPYGATAVLMSCCMGNDVRIDWDPSRSLFDIH